MWTLVPKVPNERLPEEIFKFESRDGSVHIYLNKSQWEEDMLRLFSKVHDLNNIKQYVYLVVQVPNLGNRNIRDKVRLG